MPPRMLRPGSISTPIAIGTCSRLGPRPDTHGTSPKGTAMSIERQALVLVAHADDETLGCSGTIRRLVARGWNDAVVILSDGIVRARAGEQDNRAHATAACKVLGVAEPRFLGFADQRFDAVP